MLLEADLGQSNDKATTDEEAFDDIRSFEELDKPKFVQPSRCEMTKHFAKLAGPSVITNVGSYIIMTINAVYAGQFVEDSATKLAGFGLGTMMLSMICRYVLTGINCAQETLVSQAFGQRQLKLSGVYLSRGFFIMTVVYIPLGILLCFS